MAAAAVVKIRKLVYHSNGVADLREIWQGYAKCFLNGLKSKMFAILDFGPLREHFA